MNHKNQVGTPSTLFPGRLSVRFWCISKLGKLLPRMTLREPQRRGVRATDLQISRLLEERTPKTARTMENNRENTMTAGTLKLLKLSVKLKSRKCHHLCAGPILKPREKSTDDDENEFHFYASFERRVTSAPARDLDFLILCEFDCTRVLDIFFQCDRLCPQLNHRYYLDEPGGSIKILRHRSHRRPWLPA